MCEYRQRKRATTVNFNNFAPEFVSSKFAISIFVVEVDVKRFALRGDSSCGLMPTFFVCLTFPSKAQFSKLRAACTRYFAALFHLLGSSEGLILLVPKMLRTISIFIMTRQGRGLFYKTFTSVSFYLLETEERVS